MKKIISSIAILSLSACATITSSGGDPVTVTTVPKSGAMCDLRNSKGQWQVAKTPGMVNVPGAHGDMTIICKHPDGDQGVTSLTSSTRGAAFGNILAGGFIGAAVDMSSGAAYKYPSSAIVTLSSDVNAVQKEIEKIEKEKSEKKADAEPAALSCPRHKCR